VDRLENLKSALIERKSIGNPKNNSTNALSPQDALIFFQDKAQKHTMAQLCLRKNHQGTFWRLADKRRRVQDNSSSILPNKPLYSDSV
jgi:hypothetical protein